MTKVKIDLDLDDTRGDPPEFELLGLHWYEAVYDAESEIERSRALRARIEAERQFAKRQKVNDWLVSHGYHEIY